MSASKFVYSEWAKRVELIGRIELPLANMTQGTNSRITTHYGVLTCAKRIIEKGWDQTTPFVWKMMSEEDWEKYVFHYVLN
jgi:hypothetical protein